MSFLLIPAEAPARIVHGHPTDSLISDSLGGAVPVPLTISHQLTGFWLRETCVAEGLARNPVAAVMARSMGGALVPMMGPVAVTTFLPIPSPEPIPECIPEPSLASLAMVARDIQRAVDGARNGFEVDQLDEAWSDKIREVAYLVDLVPVPENWPHRPVVDEVAEVFRKLGLHVADGQISVGT